MLAKAIEFDVLRTVMLNLSAWFIGKVALVMTRFMEFTGSA